MRLAHIVVDDIAPDATELERLISAGQKLMPGDGTFQVIPPGFGPTVYYESAVGAAPCVPALLHNVAERNGDCDAMLIGCFLDPGLRAAREISNVPVYGGGEASLLLCQFLARRFGIATIEDTNIPEISEYVTSMRLADRCAGINSVSMPYYALVSDIDETLRRLEDRTATAGRRRRGHHPGLHELRVPSFRVRACGQARRASARPRTVRHRRGDGHVCSRHAVQHLLAAARQGPGRNE